MNEYEKEELKRIDYDEIYLSWKEISTNIEFFIDGRFREGDLAAIRKALATFTKGTEKAMELIKELRNPLPMTVEEVEAMTPQEVRNALCAILRLEASHKKSSSL